jgi:hypothetical protein
MVLLLAQPASGASISAGDARGHAGIALREHS